MTTGDTQDISRLLDYSEQGDQVTDETQNLVRAAGKIKLEPTTSRRLTRQQLRTQLVVLRQTLAEVPEDACPITRKALEESILAC